MLWRILLVGLIGYALYRMFIHDRQKKSNDSQKKKEQMVATGEMTKDPTCGAYVDTKNTISVRNGETVYHFCSYDCRDTFLKKIDKLPEGKES